MNKLQLILRGIVKENPTFVLVLGMCPTLGTTTSAANGFGMGVATMAVLIMSNFVISLVKNVARLGCQLGCQLGCLRVW